MLGKKEEKKKIENKVIKEGPSRDWMDINTVFLKDMPFEVTVGKDAWQRDGKAQPIRVTLRVNRVRSVEDAAASDEVGNNTSLDYGKLYKEIRANLVDGKTRDHGFANVRQVAGQVLASIPTPGLAGSVRIELPKAALRAEGGLVYCCDDDGDEEDNAGDRETPVQHNETLHIRGVRCACIIGLNPHERRDKQIVLVHLTFRAPARSQASATSVAVDRYHNIIETVVKVRTSENSVITPLSPPYMPHHRFFPLVSISVRSVKPYLQGELTRPQRVEGSSYQTVEALATVLCRDVAVGWDIPEVGIEVEKPYAIPSIGAAGVCIRRRKSFFARTDI